MSTTSNAEAGTTRPQTKLGTLAATRLVANREISTQVRSKAFVISLVVTVVVIIGGIIAMGFFGGDDDEGGQPVAGVELTEDVTTQVEAVGLEVTSAASEEEAEQLLRDEEVDAILTPDETSPVGLHLIGLDEMPMDIAQQLSVAPTMEVLEDGEQDGFLVYIAAMAFGLVFMIVAMGSGSMIMQNTIQEKQNRIVEILLSAIPARALLAGKILGNSVLAIGQAVVMGIAAVVGLAISGQLDYLEMFSWPMMWFVLFFIPGFLLIASVFAASASLVSRQEDSGSVMTPAMMLVMIPYFVVIFFLNNDTVMQIASYVPISAPVAMPVRMFADSVHWYEPVLSIALLLLTALLVMLLASKIYSRSLLQMGQRVKLSAALKSEE